MSIETMTDNLRDRIAAVIRREVPCHPPAANRVADAVIRELELQQETGIEVRHSMPPFEATRYVTPWKLA